MTTEQKAKVLETYKEGPFEACILLASLTSLKYGQDIAVGNMVVFYEPPFRCTFHSMSELPC